MGLPAIVILIIIVVACPALAVVTPLGAMSNSQNFDLTKSFAAFKIYHVNILILKPFFCALDDQLYPGFCGNMEALFITCTSLRGTGKMVI